VHCLRADPLFHEAQHHVAMGQPGAVHVHNVDGAPVQPHGFEGGTATGLHHAGEDHLLAALVQPAAGRATGVRAADPSFMVADDAEAVVVADGRILEPGVQKLLVAERKGDALTGGRMSLTGAVKDENIQTVWCLGESLCQVTPGDGHVRGEADPGEGNVRQTGHLDRAPLRRGDDVYVLWPAEAEASLQVRGVVETPG
jgi:hypothetical protein